MTEEKTKASIFPIMYLLGANNLEMSDLKRIYPQYINLEESDLEGRDCRHQEHKYKQNIGNISSHQDTTFKNYKYGYQIDKQNPRMAVFRLQQGLLVRSFIDDMAAADLELQGIRSRCEHTECQYPDLIDAVTAFEKQRISCFYGDNEKRVYNIVKDYEKIASRYLLHIISINDLGEPITIFVEPYEDCININSLSTDALRFLETRCYERQYTRNKNYIYFVKKDGTCIKAINTLEIKDFDYDYFRD